MTGNDSREIDGMTVAAIAIVAYSAANLVHEGLGHGGACLLVGGRPESLNAIFFSFDEASVSNRGRVVIAAGGSVANVIFGWVAAFLLARWKHLPASVRYFLWLFCAVNLLQASGYLLFSGVAGVGDWMSVVAPLGSPVLSRTALVAIGGLTYFWLVARYLDRRLGPFLAPGPDGGGRLGALARLPYLVGGSTLVLAGLLNPYGWKLVLLSAVAASFGGTSLLVWYPFRGRSADPASAPPTIPRSRPWLAAAALAWVVFVGVFGRGIGAPR